MVELFYAARLEGGEAMTDNRMTELLKGYAFALQRLEYDADKPGSKMTLDEYEAEEKRVTDEYAQAIAATLGSGTCEMETLERWDGSQPSFRCKECGHENYEDGIPNYCPNCRRKVVNS